MKLSKSLVVALAATALSALSAHAAPGDGMGKSDQFWWPEKVDLQPLRQHAAPEAPDLT